MLLNVTALLEYLNFFLSRFQIFVHAVVFNLISFQCSGIQALPLPVPS